MIKLKKDETKKTYWAKRNGLRLKISKFKESISDPKNNNYITHQEKQYVESIDRILGQLLTKWDKSKDIINKALEINAE